MNKTIKFVIDKMNRKYLDVVYLVEKYGIDDCTPEELELLKKCNEFGEAFCEIVRSGKW